MIIIQAELPRVTTEIAAMKDLHHQHICKLFQVIETDNRFFLILEVSCTIYWIMSSLA